MFSDKAKKIIILAGDIFILYASLAVVLVARYGIADFSMRLEAHLVPFSAVFPAWILALYLFNLYRYKTAKLDSIFRQVFMATFFATGFSIVLFYLFPEFFQLTPRVNMALFAAIFMVLKSWWQRLMVFRVFARGTEKIIFIGDSRLMAETALHLKDNPHIGYSIEAWFDDPEKLDFNALSEKMKETGTHLVVVQDHLTRKAGISNLIYGLLSHKVNVLSFWHFYETVFDKVPLKELEEGWFIENIKTHRPIYGSAKRIMDLAIAVPTLVIFSPIMVIVALLIKFSSDGPAVYKQARMGKNEKPFTLYKFRTMRHNSKGPLWTTDNDNRITPLGRILRNTHLDELPQLFNIIKGDISLVGPRAERMELAEKFNSFPYYEMRHIIKPGVTGWAQVNFRPSASMEEAKEKLGYDLYYIKNSDIFLDTLIILRTIRFFFSENK